MGGITAGSGAPTASMRTTRRMRQGARAATCKETKAPIEWPIRSKWGKPSFVAASRTSSAWRRQPCVPGAVAGLRPRPRRSNATTAWPLSARVAAIRSKLRAFAESPGMQSTGAPFGSCRSRGSFDRIARMLESAPRHVKAKVRRNIGMRRRNKEAGLLVKKYGNRRLYDTNESRYITLEELAGSVRQGKD